LRIVDGVVDLLGRNMVFVVSLRIVVEMIDLLGRDKVLVVLGGRRREDNRSPDGRRSSYTKVLEQMSEKEGGSRGSLDGDTI